MTGLQRTTLTTPRKVDFAANVLARQEEHGAKAQLGRDFGVSRPSRSPTTSWYSPLASENHAIFLPSGLHTGLRSCVPGERVRLRCTRRSA